MTKGKSPLIQNDTTHLKGTVPRNNRSVKCLPMMWKMLTAQIREAVYYSLTSRRLFPKEQKGYRKGSRGTGELHYMDQQVFNENKTKRKNLTMAWIDFKKVYDRVPKSWIINCLKMYKISDEVINLMFSYMECGIDSSREKSG